MRVLPEQQSVQEQFACSAESLTNSQAHKPQVAVYHKGHGYAGHAWAGKVDASLYTTQRGSAGSVCVLSPGSAKPAPCARLTTCMDGVITTHFG